MIVYRVGNRIRFPWYNDLGRVDMVECVIIAIGESGYEVEFELNGEPTTLILNTRHPNITFVAIR